MGTQDDGDVTMISQTVESGCCQVCVCHMELKLGILNVENKIAKKDPSMELFDSLRHKKKDVLTQTHGCQLNNAVFVLVLKQSSEHFVMVWIFANKIRK